MITFSNKCLNWVLKLDFIQVAGLIRTLVDPFSGLTFSESTRKILFLFSALTGVIVRQTT